MRPGPAFVQGQNPGQGRKSLAKSGDDTPPVLVREGRKTVEHDPRPGGQDGGRPTTMGNPLEERSELEDSPRPGGSVLLQAEERSFGQDLAPMGTAEDADDLPSLGKDRLSGAPELELAAPCPIGFHEDDPPPGAKGGEEGRWKGQQLPAPQPGPHGETTIPPKDMLRLADQPLGTSGEEDAIHLRSGSARGAIGGGRQVDSRRRAHEDLARRCRSAEGFGKKARLASGPHEGDEGCVPFEPGPKRLRRDHDASSTVSAP